MGGRRLVSRFIFCMLSGCFLVACLVCFLLAFRSVCLVAFLPAFLPAFLVAFRICFLFVFLVTLLVAFLTAFLFAFLVTLLRNFAHATQKWCGWVNWVGWNLHLCLQAQSKCKVFCHTLGNRDLTSVPGCGCCYAAHSTAYDNNARCCQRPACLLWRQRSACAPPCRDIARGQRFFLQRFLPPFPDFQPFWLWPFEPFQPLCLSSSPAADD